MNKAELVKQVATAIGTTEKGISVTLNTILEAITNAVADGDKVTLVGFGTFEARTRKEREGRNPQTGGSLTIPATIVPVFSPGKAFKDAVEQGVKTEEAA
jgi:DNA-binding protein HU-beta